MPKDWNYAQMTQDAAACGGPDKWLAAIKKASYEQGASDMKNTLVVPLLLGGASIGALTVIGFQKIRVWIAEHKQKKLLSEQEAAKAEAYLKQELADAIGDIENATAEHNDSKCPSDRLE